MWLKDRFCTKIRFYQQKDGKIGFSLGNIHFTLSKEDSQKIDVYSITDFDHDLFNSGYLIKE